VNFAKTLGFFLLNLLNKTSTAKKKIEPLHWVGFENLLNEDILGKPVWGTGVRFTKLYQMFLPSSKDSRVLLELLE
jgi:hypothetical protein